MSLGRRRVDVQDHAAWVFNRIGTAYAARPPYPSELIDALAALATPGCAVADLGAGIGHVALPLAERGFSVSAVEPARAMLDCLQHRAARLGAHLQPIHARAECLPLAAASHELIVVADSLHFLDAELAGHEIARVMTPSARLAIVTCEPADTPFMREVVRIMSEAAPRRPRATAAAAVQLAALCDVELTSVTQCHDATPVAAEQLADILRSISFIGPALNRERWSTFEARIGAIPYPRVWERSFRLHSGQRRRGTMRDVPAPQC